MSKLNEKQIIKALECCTSGNSVSACMRGCPLYEEEDCECINDDTALHKYALSLIKELTEERKDFEIRALRAENEVAKYKDRYETAKQAHDMLSESYDHLEKTKDELLAERSRLTEENERLRAELTGANKDKQILFDEISSLEAEAEKAIDIAEGNIRAEIASGGTSCHWCEDKVKADTVRKMQERLKEHLQKPEFPWDSFTVSEEFIDQIAKEMLEGK